MQEIPNPNPLPGGDFEELPEGTRIWQHISPGGESVYFREDPNKTVSVQVGLPGRLPWEEIPSDAGGGKMWLSFTNGGVTIETRNGRITSVALTVTAS